MIHTRLRALITPALLLAGCATSAPPDRPLFDLPPSSQGVAGVDSAELPQGPLTLEQALAFAVERNPDTRAALERIGAARARLSEAESAFYPQVMGRLSYVGTNQPAQAFGLIVGQRRFRPIDDPNDPDFTQNYRPEVVVALPVFRGGGDWYRREAARLGAEAREYEHAAVQNGLRAGVVSAFYLVHAALQQVEVSVSSVAAVERELEATRARVAAGTSLRADALTLEVRVAEARDGLLRVRNAVQRGRAGLRALLALPPQARVELAPPPAPDAGAWPASVDEAIQRAYADRPELVAAERMVSARDRQVDQAWAGYLPRVDAFGSYGHDDRGLELSSKRDNWTVGVQVELDLFSGFLTSSRVRRARHELSEARALADGARLEVEREVTEAFLALDEAREREQVNAASVAAAEEAFRLVRQQYETGAVTVTRLLEAEVASAGARSRAIAARFDVRRAEAELRRAMGGWR